MDVIVSRLSRSDKTRLTRTMRRCPDPRMRARYLIILTLADGVSPTETAKRVRTSRSTVYRVAERFRIEGERGLDDRRANNGSRKIHEGYLTVLTRLVASTPGDFGWPRPTWTCELLTATALRITQVRVHPATMSKLLRKLGARRGRPKPIVACPWSNARKKGRIRAIKRLERTLSDADVLVYEDEVDIHLNPKMGCDWMPRGQQKPVLTPGKNQKRYLAGALDARTGELTWVTGERKNSPLFVDMLWALLRRYRSIPLSKAGTIQRSNGPATPHRD